MAEKVRNDLRISLILTISKYSRQLQCDIRYAKIIYCIDIFSPWLRQRCHSVRANLGKSATLVVFSFIWCFRWNECINCLDMYNTTIKLQVANVLIRHGYILEVYAVYVLIVTKHNDVCKYRSLHRCVVLSGRMLVIRLPLQLTWSCDSHCVHNATAPQHVAAGAIALPGQCLQYR